MRAMPDEEVFAWAAAQRCWLLPENVKDLQPIRLRALQANASTAGLLSTSSRTFPRSRQHIGPLVDALDAWLAQGPPEPPIIEDWLKRCADSHRFLVGVGSGGVGVEQRVLTHGA